MKAWGNDIFHIVGKITYFCIMRKLAAILAAALLALPLLAQRHAVVNLSANYLRAKPDYESALETQELMGTVVTILGEDRYWRKVSTPQPYTAWCTSLGLVEMDEKELQQYEAAPKYICTAAISAVYESPKKGAAMISDLVMGDLMRIVYAQTKKGEKPLTVKKMAAVKLPDGKMGYVSVRDIADYERWKATRRPGGSAAARTAEQFVGIPYLWGGMSPKGFDCSGLVRMSYLMNGIVLPRNASQMAELGDEISTDVKKLRPGDLLFFGTPASMMRKQRITHVGMYLGNGRFIHSSQLVRVNSMIPGDPDCYENIDKLLFAKRISRL